MLKALDCFRKALCIVMLCMFVALIFEEFNDICHATQTLLYKADQLTSLEMPGAKVVFTTKRVDAAFSALNVDDVEPAKRRHALDLIHKLKQAEFVRLMYVEQLKVLCEYESPADSKTRYDVANDYKLVEMKLAEMSPATGDEFRQKQQEFDAGHSENGKPLRCYRMELTGEGWDLKTALVGSFGENFMGGSDKTIPSGQQIASN